MGRVVKRYRACNIYIDHFYLGIDIYSVNDTFERRIEYSTFDSSYTMRIKGFVYLKLQSNE